MGWWWWWGGYSFKLLKAQSFWTGKFCSMRASTVPLFVQPAWLHASSDNSTLVIDRFFNTACVLFFKFSFSASSLLMPWYNPCDLHNVLFNVRNVFGHQICLCKYTAESSKGCKCLIFILWGRRRQEVSVTTHRGAILKYIGVGIQYCSKA